MPGIAAGGVTTPPPPAAGGVPGTVAGGVGTPATAPLPGAPGADAGGIAAPALAGVPGAPGTLAGGIGTLPATEAGGVGPPAVGDFGARIDDAAPGTPLERSGGLVTTFCMMLMHGTPPMLGSATAKWPASGAVQKNPAVAIAVAAATRVVVRDMCFPISVVISDAKLQPCKTVAGLTNLGVTEPWPSGAVMVTEVLCGMIRVRRNAARNVCLRTSSTGKTAACGSG